MKLGAALFAFASIGLVAFNYGSGEEASQLFLSERLEADEAAYIKYLTEFSKSYVTKEEYKFRLAEFKKSLKKVAEHDEAATGHSVGLNQFSDFTDDEYRTLLGLKIPANVPSAPEAENVDESSLNLPSSMDWRTVDMVTAVKN